MNSYEIKPAKWLSLNIKELSRFRELFFFMAWRDIKVKYKQTLLGFLWVVLQPLILMIIFNIVWQNVIKFGNINIPYPLFAYSGLIFWGLFSSGITNAGDCMISNSNIIKKVYFPRIIIPASAMIVALFDFLMTLVLYIILIIYFHVPFLSFTFFGYLVISILITIISSFGIGLIIASATIKYRDFRYVVPFFLQAIFFLSPVVAPLSLYGSGKLHYFLSLNPLAGAINLNRAVLSDNIANWHEVLLSTGIMFILFITGITLFRRMESQYADLL